MGRESLTDKNGEVRELSSDDMRHFEPAHALIPEIVEEFKRARGRPKSDNPKVSVTLRLDAQIIEHFKSGGKGWQTRINQVLKQSLSK
ncbi:MAG: BrnA antitoxin family protein [Pseudomonadota bacterium]